MKKYQLIQKVISRDYFRRLSRMKIVPRLLNSKSIVAFGLGETIKVYLWLTNKIRVSLSQRNNLALKLLKRCKGFMGLTMDALFLLDYLYNLDR